MKYYAINFENYTTVFVTTREDWEAVNVARMLNHSSAVIGIDGTAYNSRQFISVTPITSPDARHTERARFITDVVL